MLVCGSNGSPTRTGAKLAARASTSSSWRLRVTMTRVSDEHAWPARKHSAPARIAAVEVDVGVVEDEGGRLPAQLENESGNPLAADRSDLADRRLSNR